MSPMLPQEQQAMGDARKERQDAREAARPAREAWQSVMNAIAGFMYQVRPGEGVVDVPENIAQLKPYLKDIWGAIMLPPDMRKKQEQDAYSRMLDFCVKKQLITPEQREAAKGSVQAAVNELGSRIQMDNLLTDAEKNEADAAAEQKRGNDQTALQSLTDLEQ